MDKFEIHSAENVLEGGERFRIAALPDDCRRLKPRPEVDRCEDPDMVFLAADGWSRLAAQAPTTRGPLASWEPSRTGAPGQESCTPPHAVLDFMQSPIEDKKWNGLTYAPSIRCNWSGVDPCG